MWGGPYGWGPAVWSVNQNSKGSGRSLDRATVTDAHAVIVSDVYEAVRQMDYNLVCDDNQRRWIITHILQPRLIWGTWGGQGTALALSSVAGGTLGMHVRQFDYANIYKAPPVYSSHVGRAQISTVFTYGSDICNFIWFSQLLAIRLTFRWRPWQKPINLQVVPAL